MKYHAAVVGATGNVGREIISILAERQFPLDKLSVVASSHSQGKEVSFGENQVLKIQSLEDFDFTGVNIAFFAVDSEISKKYAPKAAQAGAIVIDKSSCFRLDPKVPLAVPEINAQEVTAHHPKNIIANPNCVVIPLTVALNSLHKAASIKRLVLSTYQSVSGAGRQQMDELYRQTKGTLSSQAIKPVLFPKPIAFNLIPQIDDFCANGMTGEEEKIIKETQKILGSDIQIFATCVRVPVFIGHSIAVNVEFEQELSLDQARLLLSKAPSVRVIDRREPGGYVTPIDCVGEDLVYISRLRKDPSLVSGLGLWIVCDNLRKGAALNGVQIAESLIQAWKQKK